MKDINEIFPLLDKQKKIAITTSKARCRCHGFFAGSLQFPDPVWSPGYCHFTNQLGKWCRLDAGQQESAGLRNAKAKAEAALDEAEWLFVLILIIITAQKPGSEISLAEMYKDPDRSS